MYRLPVVLLLVFAAAEDKKPMPLTPAEAAKKVNEKCTVQLEVKSAGKGNGVYFLNSKDNIRDDDNFTVFINKDGTTKLAEKGIKEPADHYKGKTVQVTGTVTLYREKPQIVVDNPDQITIVEKK